MTRLYLATVVAAAVTTSLASHMLVVHASGSAATNLSARFGPALFRALRRVKDFLDDWIAAVLAHRERQAARFVLHRLSDRELKDMGLSRSDIDQIGRCPGPKRPDSVRGHRSAGRIVDEVIR
jgi:uncharacterized protein YjiS (DUF1127 family)